MILKLTQVHAWACVYPCGTCDLNVDWSDVAVCCNNCQVWFHKSCASMSSAEFNQIENNTWHCCRCNSVNCSSFLYQAYNINVSNSYDLLSGIPGDDSVCQHSVESLRPNLFTLDLLFIVVHSCIHL